MKFCLLSIPMFMAAAPCLAVESYTVDPNHTLPVFEVKHLGFSTQRGRFDHSEGHLILDVTQKTGSVVLTITADSINMGQEKWNTHMKSKDFFNVAQFPTIIYKSEHLIFAGEKPVAAEGTLTLLGISQPVRVNIENFTCGVNPIVNKPLCAADVTADFKRSAFGMNTYLPGISDEVHALIPFEAFRD